MADISHAVQPTVAAIYAAWEATGNRDKGRRAHLGASILGRECRRALWYTFRWATDVAHDGRVLRLFDRGQREEERFAADLRAIGVTVHTVDPATGEQFRFSDIGGHVGGSMDAAAIGLLEKPTVWHCVEMKTHGDKSFADLIKKGVEASKPEHAAQMQLYMHWSGMTRAFYMAVNKNTDEIYTERLRYDAKAAGLLLAKAADIVTAPRPLERISERPDWFACKFCDHRPTCHGTKPAAVSCRTCVHATAEMDGRGSWSCARHQMAIGPDTQRAGCGDHLYIPELLPFGEPVDADGAANWIEYEHAGRRFRNGKPGPDCYSSTELAELDPALLGDPNVAMLREQMGGVIVRSVT